MSEPPDLASIQDLVTTAVDSFEKLEALLVLHRNPPWQRPAADVAAEIGMSSAAIAEALGELVRSGLVARAGSSALNQLFGYLPANPRAAEVDRLARVYESDRLAVLNLMTVVAMQRIRSAAAQTFADAFRIRPKKGDGNG